MLANRYYYTFRSLPKARVVYCSATGVTDVKNMAFMERMGLWGLNSSFKSYADFLETIQKKGLGIQLKYILLNDTIPHSLM